MNFSDLCLAPRLIKGLDALGFSSATEVQAESIPVALSEKDLMVSAETGSGKTAAFVLPMLQRFLEEDRPNSATRGLILVPTRELANQVFKQVQQLAKFTHIKAGLLTGGDSFKQQSAMLRKNPEIVIATPGRIAEHVAKKSCELQDLEVLVLDEADRMLDMGLSEDVLKTANACNPDRQTLLFSATLDNKHVKNISGEILREPQRIVLSTAKDQHENITQQMLLTDDEKLRQKQLSWLLENETYEKALVFSNTRTMTEKLNGYLNYRGFKAATLHGEMTQDQRNIVMNKFRQGHVDILVATDVAARGLDIKGVDLVINFEMARCGDDYVHRIGRTGRAGEKGLAVSLIDHTEWNLAASIQRYLKVTFERKVISPLKAKYTGPDKVKKSGKAYGSKKKKTDKKAKPKNRLRDKKNIGKSKKSSERKTPENKKFGSDERKEVGFAPLKKKK
ncbi:MAG: DEAD/DEAH box helicase [Cellvibrionaceae bacterium]